MTPPPTYPRLNHSGVADPRTTTPLGIVRSAQETLGNAFAIRSEEDGRELHPGRAVWVDTDDLEPDPAAVYHYSLRARAPLGERFAAAMRRLLRTKPAEVK